MKNIFILLTILYCSASNYGQVGELFENKVIKFSIEQRSDKIEFVVVDTSLKEKKPIFLWCQGSLPVPLLAKKENLNNGFQYIPNPDEPRKFAKGYEEADYLDNYVNRALKVLDFLQLQNWVQREKIVIAGHSQGSKVATKIALKKSDVTHLGLFAANPFGRIDQYVREARLDAQLGKISWAKADSLMNDNYEFYKQVNNEDSIQSNPSLKAWKTFSETYYDDWLSLDIPIYLAYGTEDRTSDLCDIVPFLFIEKGKVNLTIKRYLGLEHNFFELNENGRVNHEKGHWEEVMNGFVKWIE